MRGFRGSPYEGGTRVPFFIKWPGKFKAGRKVDVLMNHYDILPTLADITNIDISGFSDKIDGKSFLPWLENKSYKGGDRYRFIHAGRWPLDPDDVNGKNVNPNWIGTKESSNPDNHKYKNCAVRNERFRFVNNTELHDLYADP